MCIREYTTYDSTHGQRDESVTNRRANKVDDDRFLELFQPGNVSVDFSELLKNCDGCSKLHEGGLGVWRSE